VTQHTRDQDEEQHHGMLTAAQQIRIITLQTIITTTAITIIMGAHRKFFQGARIGDNRRTEGLEQGTNSQNADEVLSGEGRHSPPQYTIRVWGYVPIFKNF